MVAIWVQLVAPLPSAALMKAHLPGVPPSAIIFGRRNGRALARFGPRFGDHVVANLEADVPELPDSPFIGRPSGSSPLCNGKQGFFSSGRTAISAWRGRSCLEPELDRLPQQVLRY